MDFRYKYESPADYMERNYNARHWPRTTAFDLGIHNAHLYRARKGDFTPTFVKALRDRKLIPPQQTRCRIAADVTPEQRARLHALAEADGLTWSEYCRRLADE